MRNLKSLLAAAAIGGLAALPQTSTAADLVPGFGTDDQTSYNGYYPDGDYDPRDDYYARDEDYSRDDHYPRDEFYSRDDFHSRDNYYPRDDYYPRHDAYSSYAPSYDHEDYPYPPVKRTFPLLAPFVGLGFRHWSGDD